MQTFTKFFFTAIGFIAFHIFTFASTSIPNSQSQPQTAIIEAVSDTVTTLINEPISFNVLQNDTGEEIYVNLALQPSYGSLAWSVNGDFTYTPNENHVGPDVLVYQIKDNEGNTESANVFITVEGATDLPLQVNVFHECYEPGFYRLWVYVSGGTPPYESFIQYGDDLTNPTYQDYFFFDELFLNEIPTSMGFFVFVRDAENNTVLENHLFEIICHEDVINACIAETHLELTPIITCNEGEKTIEVIATGGSGEYSYSGHFLEYSGDAVIVEDSEGCQNILFYDEVPAYTCPIAIDDVVNGAYNAPFHLKPLLNDIGDDLTISDISGLKHGTIQWKPDQFLAYYPNEGFAGIDTLEYEITDPMGNSARAKILAVVPENDEVTIFWERDCTRAADEGVYEINFTVAGGKPPYVLDGDFLTSEYRGDEILSFTKADGDDFSITAIDKDGESITVQTNELTPCTFLPHPTSDFTVFISCVEGQDYGILTALDPFGEPLQNDFEGNSHGDTIPNSSIYSAHFSEFLEIPFEEIVFCPPIAEDDLYHSHPSYLHLPLTFNPLLNDSGHGLKLVKVESPNYGNVEWWQADGTINYRPNTDFQGVETFDYTLEDIGGNRTSATITLIFAHPTKLKITYERDCFEVNNNGAENYTVNAFVSGGVPPYQVQVNEDAFFEVTENGGDFSFEVPNGEGFQIYAEDNGAVTHTAMVEESEVLPCSSLCDNLSLGVNLTCSSIDGTGVLNFGVIGANGNFVVNGNYDGDTLAYGEGYFVEIIDEQGCKISDTGGCDGSELQVQVERDCMNAEATGVYVLNVYITGGTPPFTISGSINETLEGLGSAFNVVTDGNHYEVTVVDATGEEFYEKGGYSPCVGNPVILLDSIDEITTCICGGNMVFNFEGIVEGKETLSVMGSWDIDDGNNYTFGIIDTIPANAFFVIEGILTESVAYGIVVGDNFEPLEGFVSDFCSPETYTLEAIDDFANSHPGDSVNIIVLQNDIGTNLQVSSIILAPSCGEIVDINPETGVILYVADSDTNCSVDTFVYEVIDECGNLTEATVTIFITPDHNYFIAYVERDCNDVEETGFYALNISLYDGTPPYTITGTIDTILYESSSNISVQIEDGTPYELSIIDADGAEFYELGGEVSCCQLGFLGLALNESESQTTLCGTGSIVLSLEGGGEGTTYHWYLDAEGTVPANPSTGQIWENDEIVGARTVYVIATGENGCQSEPLAISTFHYHELEVINFEIEIDELCENYQVTFVITGGNESYTVNGQVAFHIVTRPWQPIEEDYFFTIDDSPLIPNCEPVVISGSVDETDCCIGGTLEITPSFDCLITQTQDSIALLTYQATGGDGTYTFNGNPQNDTLQNGDIYQIEVTDGNGCTASIIDTVNCFFTSIENPDIHSSTPKIHLFPNPNKGNFTLSLESKQAEEINIEVFDIIGRVKLWQRLETLPTVERQEDFNLDVPSGLYFIRVSGKDWTWTEKMVVE